MRLADTQAPGLPTHSGPGIPPHGSTAFNRFTPELRWHDEQIARRFSGAGMMPWPEWQKSAPFDRPKSCHCRINLCTALRCTLYNLRHPKLSDNQYCALIQQLIRIANSKRPGHDRAVFVCIFQQLGSDLLCSENDLYPGIGPVFFW